ncbi:MAG: hypothetical protein HYU41_16300 [Candidatus Rokubacteria bacterium]|nr:hypothetical protein [Candidatus Rokubacteria bacterium]
MNNPWKMTTIGIALVLVTALTTGLATAYFTGPREPERTARVAPARTTQYRATVAAPQYVASAAPAAACDGNAKFGRIAKDGLIGGLVGAAVGAGAGAIADGGRAAGKGAGIGALTGVAAGGLYGAHQNATRCP